MIAHDVERAWFLRGCSAVLIGLGCGAFLFGLGYTIGYGTKIHSIGNRGVHETRDDAKPNAGDAGSNLPGVIYEKAEPYSGRNRAQYS